MNLWNELREAKFMEESLYIEKTVSSEDCALTLKSGELEVLSTPTVLAWMEEVSANLARKFLTLGEATVGVHVELDHLAPAFIGDKVRIESVLKERGTKKLVFDITAKSKEKILAKAKHVRVIVNRKRFAK